MGQRLNLELTDGKKVLANCYYHWSGYTLTALELAKNVIENSKGIEPTVENAVKLLKITGAGTTNKNDGLISITDNEIKNTQDWAESMVVINLLDKTINLEGAGSTYDFLGDGEIEERVKHLFKTIDSDHPVRRLPFPFIYDVISGVKESIDNYWGRYVIRDSYFLAIY